MGKTVASTSLISNGSPSNASKESNIAAQKQWAKNVSQVSEVTDPGRYGQGKVSRDTLERLQRIDSKDIIDEIRRRLGLEDLEVNGVPLDWFDDDLKDHVTGGFE